jgi:large subunit ribosomal protein L25
MSENLNGILREKMGTRSARILRLQGRIPACLQGESKAHLNFSLGTEEFMAARRRKQLLFDIGLDAGEVETAMVRELQYDAFGDNIVHVEFRRVVRGRKTEAEVQITFRGHPKDGILNQLVATILVEAIPSMIPESIECKVEELETGAALYAGDLELPEGVSLSAPTDLQIAVVIAPRGIEMAAEEEAEEGAEATGEEDAAAATEETEG